MSVDRITYVLRFHRPKKDAPTIATGLRVETHVAGATVSSDLRDLEGEKANLDLQYALNQDGTQFFEWGTLTFGEGDPSAATLAFSSIGAGSLPGPPDADGFSHGVVTYRIDSGTGALEGATGMITSNFLVDLATEELIDTHLGIIRLP